MTTIIQDSIVDIAFQLRWESDHATHTEGYAARGVNLWRDWLPDNVLKELLGKSSWENAAVYFTPGELFGKNGRPM